MALPQKGKCHCNIWRIVMPFQINVVMDHDKDKVKGCDFDVSTKSKKVKKISGGGGLNGDDPGTIETFTQVTLNLNIVFQLEKYGRLSQLQTYGFDCSSDSSIKDFLQDLEAIYRLSKTAESASVIVIISKTAPPKIWLTNYRPDCIPFSVGLGFIEKGDCNTPYLNVAGTGYYLQKEDLKVLGEWLLSNVQ